MTYFGFCLHDLCGEDNRNILRDDSGHLKVADFGVSKLLRKSMSIREDRPLSCHDSSCKLFSVLLFYINDPY